MNIEPRTPTIKNPPEQFTGDVWFDPIITPHDGDQRMSGGLVRFAPGSRTAWHSHARGQYLRVTEGTALDRNVTRNHHLRHERTATFARSVRGRRGIRRGLA